MKIVYGLHLDIVSLSDAKFQICVYRLLIIEANSFRAPYLFSKLINVAIHAFAVSNVLLSLQTQHMLVSCVLSFYILNVAYTIG